MHFLESFQRVKGVIMCALLCVIAVFQRRRKGVMLDLLYAVTLFKGVEKVVVLLSLRVKCVLEIAEVSSLFAKERFVFGKDSVLILPSWRADGILGFRYLESLLTLVDRTLAHACGNLLDTRR